MLVLLCGFQKVYIFFYRQVCLCHFGNLVAIFLLIFGVMMKNLVGVAGFLIAMILLVPGVCFSWPVPDTGQTKCYDAEGNVLDPCPSEGEDFYGQDASYIINPMSYTKLDGSGNDLPDSASEWVMVKDNVTGLIWEVKRNKDGVKNYDDPHDADNTYTWYDSNPATNCGDAGTPGGGTDTEDFIIDLNNANFGGYSDWRLPNREELWSIVDCSIRSPGPAINAAYFPDAAASWYYSCTTYAKYTYRVWGVYFKDGASATRHKGESNYIRAVRGGQSQSSYVANGNGTVTDISTGLTWQQATAPGTYTWEQALDYCEDLNLGTRSDWRLPTIKELGSIVDLTRYNPSINTDFFPNTAASGYWSSNTRATYTDIAWQVDFGYGHDELRNTKYNSYYVRAVCTAQIVSYGDLTVDIEPYEARNAGVKWSVRELSYLPAIASNQTYWNIPTGEYTVHFESAEGWSVPLDYIVEVEEGSTTTFTGECHIDPIGKDPILDNEYCVGFSENFYVFELGEMPEEEIPNTDIDDLEYQIGNIVYGFLQDYTSLSSILTAIATNGVGTWINSTINIMEFTGLASQSQLIILDNQGNRFNFEETINANEVVFPMIFIRTTWLGGETYHFKLHTYTNYEYNLSFDTYDEKFTLETEASLAGLKPYALYVLIPRTTIISKQGTQWSAIQKERGMEGMIFKEDGNHMIQFISLLPTLGLSEYKIQVESKNKTMPWLNLLLLD